jgi:cyclophilin family peptidyl-prolyl cis-trans isomerase
MKKLIPTLLLLAFGAPLLRADDVALMQIHFAKQKGLKSVVIEFYDADAPATVANFKKLAAKKFYDGINFHRAFPDTLVQVGDPYSRSRDKSRVGTGGPGYTLNPEIHHKHILGAVAMARLSDKINPSRLSNGSQFFVCLKPMPEYDGQYTVFGHVFSGLETLTEISNLPVDTNDSPVEKVTIRSLRIIPREKLPAAPTAAPAKKPKKPFQFPALPKVNVWPFKPQAS